MALIIAEVRKDGLIPAFCPRGGARDIWKCKHHEVILAGPAETGKTYACLHKLDALAWKYPGMQAAILRKVAGTLNASVLQTYRRIIKPVVKEKFSEVTTPIKTVGNNHPEWYDYPNGSRIYVGGMDNPQKVLSSERDVIYINQAEELELNDYETLLTRCTGRGGVMPYAQVFGDANPGPPNHWIINRPSLRVFHSQHVDNPTLYDDAGEITEQGERSIKILQSLTGIRRQRLYEGLWVAAEGVIYDSFIDKYVEEGGHKCRAFKPPAHWPRYLGCDFGNVNACFVFFAQEVVDNRPANRFYLYRSYKPGALKVGTQVDEVTKGEPASLIVSGGAASEDAWREEYAGYGLDVQKPMVPEVETGIERVYDMFADAQIIVCDDQHEVLGELGSYSWEVDANGNPIPGKIKDKARFHHCLEGETKITTLKGDVEIHKIVVGDIVLTRQGYKPVTNAWLTGHQLTYKVLFSDGSFLIGTGDHPVWVTGKGFISIDKLGYNDPVITIRRDHCQRSDSTTELPIIDTPNQFVNPIGSISNEAGNTCIGLFMRRCMALFQKGFTSIILTKIQPITPSATYPLWVPGSILPITTKGELRTQEHLTLPISGHLQVNGMPPRMGGVGIASMQKKYWLINHPLAGSVNIAGKNTRRRNWETALNFVGRHVNRIIDTIQGWITSTPTASCVGVSSQRINTTNQSIAPVFVQDVQLDSSRDVYNLTVDGAHEYFANGVLVSNCDSIRYIAPQMRAGNLAFPQYNSTRHLCGPIAKDEHIWTYFGGLRYDPRKPFAFVLCTTDLDGHIYVLDEVYAPGLLPLEQAERVKAVLKRNDVDRATEIAAHKEIMPNTQEGHAYSKTIAEDYWDAGLPNVYAMDDDDLNDWTRLRDYFATDITIKEYDGTETKSPALRIVESRCPNLIRTLGKITLDPKDTNDVDPRGELQLALALRAALGTRPMAGERVKRLTPLEALEKKRLGTTDWDTDEDNGKPYF